MVLETECAIHYPEITQEKKKAGFLRDFASAIMQLLPNRSPPKPQPKKAIEESRISQETLPEPSTQLPILSPVSCLQKSELEPVTKKAVGNLKELIGRSSKASPSGKIHQKKVLTSLRLSSP